MAEFEDYYQILGVDREASLQEIKRAYRDKCWILHEDRFAGAPESAKKRAEEELKRVNTAYDVLGNAEKRRAYDRDRGGRAAPPPRRPAPPPPRKPRPRIIPSRVRFSSLRPGEKKRTAFVIENAGGPCSRVWFSKPDSWVRVVGSRSVRPGEQLPLEVEIEAMGLEWGATRAERIKVKLDDEEAVVVVELRMGQAARGDGGWRRRLAAVAGVVAMLAGAIVGIVGLCPRGETVQYEGRIAFQSHHFVYDMPKSEICIMDSGSGHEIRFAREGLLDVCELGLGMGSWVQPSGVAWSPDGRRIAYARGREEAWPGVWVMETNSGSEVFFTTGCSPVWSPKGDRMVLMDMYEPMVPLKEDPFYMTSQLYIVDSDGSNRVVVTRH